MRILLLSPHTDDVELGCGGSVAKFIDEDVELFWVVFSIASESLPINVKFDILVDEFKNVLNTYGIEDKDTKIFDFKVRNLDLHRQEILERMISIRKEFVPEIVIGPSLNDFHQDHTVVANEMIRAFKTSSSIISYELPWNHVVFNTQLFIKLKKEDISKKFQALNYYQSQINQGKEYFSKEFIYGLAKARGVQCNAEYAEAFEVIRWMI